MVDTPPRSQRKKNFPPRRASEQRKDVGAAPEPRVPYAQAAEPQPETVEFTAFEETEFEETETAVVPDIVVPEIVVPEIVVPKIAAEERKNVVKGKRESGRVELGGGRII